MNPAKNLDEIHLKVLRLIEAQPELIQRQLAKEFGLSFGNLLLHQSPNR